MVEMLLDSRPGPTVLVQPGGRHPIQQVAVDRCGPTRVPEPVRLGINSARA
jgi:hypothetical protein